jgi:DNA-binding CsgD family transcriptional regulator
LMAEFWQNRGRHSEGIACLSAALERGHEAAPIVRAKAMSELALQVREVGDCGRALQLSAAAERLARTAYDERLACTTFDECLDRTTWDEGLLAQLLFVRAWNIAYCLEAWSEVVPLLEEALERILVTDPDSPLRPAILSDLGWALTRLSEVAPGRQMIEDALDFARVYSQPWAVSKNLMTLGYLDQEAGNAVIAADHYRESLEMLREIRFTLPTIYPLAGLAGLTSDRGNLEWTARLFGMIEGVWQQTGVGSSTPRLEKWQANADVARHDALVKLGDATFATELAIGRALPIDAVISEALSIARAIADGMEVLPPVLPSSASRVVREPSVPPTVHLSRREREVLTLLVQRWTAPEIAQQLSLSPRTVESHVSSLYNKLGVSSRRDATAVALRSGLA